MENSFFKIYAKNAIIFFSNSRENGLKLLLSKCPPLLFYWFLPIKEERGGRTPFPRMNIFWK